MKVQECGNMFIFEVDVLCVVSGLRKQCVVVLMYPVLCCLFMDFLCWSVMAWQGQLVMLFVHILCCNAGS